MEINSTRNKRKSIVNPEGSIVYTRDPKIQLYLEASNLKIKDSEFYQSAEEKLRGFIAQANAEKDNEYIAGLAKFMADNGLKLSPVVLSVVLSNRHYSFREKGFEKIFNTPQRIAEAIVLGKTHKLNNSFKINVLRKALEEMKPYTLRKNRMENRKVKLKDLIKLLRPKPKDEETSKLYKAIIESAKLSKLKPEDTLVSMKSDASKTDEQKLEYYSGNINKIPINQLIRNLEFIIKKGDYKQQTELMNAVIDRLNSVNDFRFFNIFDLITASLEVPELQKPLHEVTKRFIAKVKAANKMDFGKCTVLFDVSGSMIGKGIDDGFKYLVLFTLLYQDTKIWKFNDELISFKDSNVVKNILAGNLKDAKAEFSVCGSTALVESMMTLANKEELKTLVVISDEVSWKEGSDLRKYIELAANKLKGIKIVVINPAVYQGTVFSGNIIGIASLTSSIMLNLFLLEDQKRFVEYIVNYAKGDAKNGN
jgi:hypothetical protein